jgi:futalosine hydrolase
MAGVLTTLLEPGRRLLLAVAASNELGAIRAGLGLADGAAVPRWRAVEATGCIDLVQTGIGKTNAAAGIARAFDAARHGAIVSIGIGGALPVDGELSIGDAVGACASVYADEGLQTPDGFLTCSQLGFPLGAFEGNAVPTDPVMLGRLSDAGMIVRRIATVSTCSGTDALARQVAERTGASVEGMEGAAAAQTALAMGARFAEIRVVSNTTGDRAAQRWDIARAFARLGEIAAKL